MDRSGARRQDGHQTAPVGSLKRLVTHVVATRSDQELLLRYYEDILTLTHLYTQEHKDFGQLTGGMRIRGLWMTKLLRLRHHALDTAEPQHS